MSLRYCSSSERIRQNIVLGIIGGVCTSQTLVWQRNWRAKYIKCKLIYFKNISITHLLVNEKASRKHHLSYFGF